MSETPFVTIWTPLTALPIIFGLIMGVEGCVMIIANAYEIDLSGKEPWMNVDLVIGEPLLLFGVAVFASVRGLQLRKAQASVSENNEAVGSPFNWDAISLLERACWIGALLGLATVPYWLELPFPEVYIIGLALLVWLGWQRLR